MLLEPFWWYRKRGAIAAALAPLSLLYAGVAAKRAARVDPYRSKLKVICIGNFTAGGGGKTPTAIAVANMLKALGELPCFLSRGYRGTEKGPHLVTEKDSAELVGDEPLLLAQAAPTVVSADREAGAKFIEGSDAIDATVIVMDDGFQNPQLAKDLSLIVVDAGSGLGNGAVLPAGPLRAPLDRQLANTDALLLIGDGGAADGLTSMVAAMGKKVLKAKVATRGDPRWLTVLPVIAFAGIAKPEKFFATLGRNGARLVDKQVFPDHHRYREAQARRLLQQAAAQNAMLVTTEKDWVRLPEDRATQLGELKFRSRPLLIAIQFEDEAALKELLSKALKESRAT